MAIPLIQDNSIAHLLEEGGQKGGQLFEIAQPAIIDNKNTGLSIQGVWITIKEGGQLLNVSERTLKHQCKSGKYITEKVKGNGGYKYRILLSSLPDDVQIRYLSKKIISDSRPETASLSQRQETIALAWGDFLNLYEQFSNGKEYGRIVKAKKIFIEKYNRGEFPRLLKILGALTYPTVERQRKKWIDGQRNYQALAPQYLITKSRSITVQQSEILLSYALRPNQLRINEVIRQAREEMDIRQIACHQSDMTLRRWLQDWKKNNYNLWVLAREGEKALNDFVLPYINRDRDKIEVGDILVADGHNLNFEIINPFTGKPKRMILILVSDFKSSMPLGWEIMPTENVRAIASAYRRAILNLGFIPRVFYLDNGKAFSAKYFAGKDLQTIGLNGLFERLGCKVINAWPYHAQSKPIERFFETFGELERLTPTYTGTSIKDRPARFNRGEKWHNKMYEKLSQGTVPTLLEAHYTIADWFARYAQRPQQQGYLKGKTPLGAYMASLDIIREQPGFDSRSINPEELAYLMMDSEIKSLYRNGILFMGRYYYHDDLFAMEKGRGHKFIIRYDIENLDNILVYLPSGEFLCKAIAPNKIHPAARQLGMAEDIKQLEEAIERKRMRQKETRELTQALWGHFHKKSITQPEEMEMLELPALCLPEKKKEPEPDRDDFISLLAKAPQAMAAEEKQNDLNLFLKPQISPRKIYMFESDRIIEEREKQRQAENE